MAKILLLNGPNLGALGQREPHLYGHTTLEQIEEQVRSRIEAAGHSLHAFQSNSEGALVDWLQQQRPADFLLVNGAGYTHTSIALRDAIAFLGAPFIEIHLSNVYKREAFRHHSYLSDLAMGVIVGLGAMGYDLAAQYAIAHLAGGTGAS